MLKTHILAFSSANITEFSQLNQKTKHNTMYKRWNWNKSLQDSQYLQLTDTYIQ